MSTSSRPFPPGAWLLAATVVCGAVLAVQERLPGAVYLDFLSWNLFLAWIPWLFALLAERLHRAGRRARLAVAACAGAWLIFFPNAPYLVTDLVHLDDATGTPLVIAAVTVAVFALTGLLLAFASLRRMQLLVAWRLGDRAGWALVGGVSLLTGLGVYLGRVQRWNSWDLLSRPEALLADIAERAADPLAHQFAVAVTVGFGAAFLAAYVALERVVEPRLRRPTRRS